MNNQCGLYFKYFVLNPTKDDPYGEASRQAIREYAYIIRKENPKLAQELETWVNYICEEIAIERGG